jgi:hypothetical protein
MLCRCHCCRCPSDALCRSMVCYQSSGQKMPLMMPCKPCAAYLCGLLLQNCKSRTKCPAAALCCVPPFLCGFRRILPQPSKGDALRLFPLRDAAFFHHPPPGCPALPGAFGCVRVRCGASDRLRCCSPSLMCASCVRALECTQNVTIFSLFLSVEKRRASLVFQGFCGCGLRMKSVCNFFSAFIVLFSLRVSSA